MSTPLPPVRRIVTAIDDQGRSYIAEDGPSPATMGMAERPGYRNNNLWRTVGARRRLSRRTRSWSIAASCRRSRGR